MYKVGLAFLMAGVMAGGGLWGGEPASGRVLQLKVVPPDYRLEYFPRVYAPGQRRLILALGGGAAKGIAHVGVLQRLQEEGLVIDGIAGTSMGACIGSLYATGYSGPSMQVLLEKVDIGALLLDRQHRFPGETLWEQENERTTFLSLDYKPGIGFSFSPGSSPGLDLKRALQILLSRGLLYANDSFDNLRVPFRAVSTNLQTGRASSPSNGDLATAVRASMCVPGLFNPVMMGNQQHVDGMLVQNLPVEVGRSQFGDGVVVAVEVGRGLEAVRQSSILGLAFRSLDVSVEERTEISRRAADLLLRPQTDKIPHLEFHELVGLAVRAGRVSLDTALEGLERQIYGPGGEALAPGGEITVEAPDVIRHQLNELAERTLLGGARLNRDYLRLLRRIHAAGLVQSAEIRFTAKGVVLAAEPYPSIQKLDIQASAEWLRLVEGILKKEGVVEGAVFNPVAFGRALDAFFLEATLLGRPMVDVMGTRFEPDTGLLTLCIREGTPDRIRVAEGILSKGQTTYLQNLLKPSEGRPFDALYLTRRFLLAEKRLGLEEMRVDSDPTNPGRILVATPIPDDKIVFDVALAYESTWQAQGSANIRVNRLWGSDLSVRVDACTNKLWDGGGLHVAHAFGRWPRLGFEVSGEVFEHHFISGEFQAPYLVDSEVSKLNGRTLREQKIDVGLSVRVGMEDRGLISLTGSRSWAWIQPDLAAAPKPRLDQVQLRGEWDSFDRYLFPTEGFLIRARLGQGWQTENGLGSRSYHFAYLRTRHLWRTGSWGSVEEDLEAGLGWDLPIARWYTVGGPAFLAGSPSAGFLTQNFAMLRLGLPFHVTKRFGVNVQVVPRVDAGYLGSATAGRLRDAAFVKGAGVSVRSEIGRWFCELAIGRWFSTDAIALDRTRINILLGAHPFDLWGRR